MYDIFDDIFDDGYGYNDYGMSDTDVDVELAFEAAMGSGYDDYDYAYEGFSDTMGKIGNKIADTARNMVRKIGELFRKLGAWLKDKFAPIRAKSASKDNKVLAQTLKALDGQVQRAAPNRKAEVKQKVARVKRAIMQVIDSTKRTIDIVNRAFSDMVGIANAMKPIGTSFIEKMNAAVMDGSEKENSEDGNDLIDKMNALERRSADIEAKIKEAMSDLSNSDANKIIDDELPGQSEKMRRILYYVKFDKIDMSGLFRVENVLQEICTQGRDASDRLQTKLGDQYMRWNRDTRTNEPTSYDRNNARDRERMFDNTSKEHLSSLINNWGKYEKMVQTFSSGIVRIGNQIALSSGTAQQNKSGANVGLRGGIQNPDAIGPDAYVSTYNARATRYERNQTPSERGEDITSNA